MSLVQETPGSGGPTVEPDCEWRGAQKFVRVLGGLHIGGVDRSALYLREAEKRPLGESFETSDSRQVVSPLRRESALQRR
ncbi:hypothetical protein ALI144C_01925 [Actinosynnema sp. ALI-1.44]|uniref:hypothetical protein n=1 Tax=Actinosynnema sp. ALI-1.44 TaxID=1933779 RepID=UPI00097C145B|nr:hypothetical protein [Actinosynnema sp. ALI-1.44]ONI91005.1 hypothetical protein ALI144C_01925 [Actinosynnema sp. ALI-1.44]